MDPGEDCIYAHIDMDCYFVQIALQKYPQYKDSPVAVSSSDSYSFLFYASLEPIVRLVPVITKHESKALQKECG